MLDMHSIFRSGNRPRLAKLNTTSDVMQREEQLRFIASELSHRNKNLLAVVQAIAAQTERQSVSRSDFHTHFSQRLQGLSRSVDLLTQEEGHGVSIAELVRSQIEPFGEVDGVRIMATGPAVSLNPEAAQNIGMALHELATNALKHGALSVPEGVITVRWELGPGDVAAACFHLVWRESNGPQVAPPKRQGFGHIVLQRMTGQALQGKVNHEFEAHGVSWSLEVPSAAVVMRAAADRPREMDSSVSRMAHLFGTVGSTVLDGARLVGAAG